MRVLLGFSLCICLAAAVAAQTTAGGGDAAALAKKSQNPVSDLVSIPFQHNLNYGVGSSRRTQWLMNMQPVIPTKLNADWNLISRVILPITYRPLGLESSATGTGDATVSMFFSPSKAGRLIWGAGPVLGLPTASDKSLGGEKWTAGPTAVALTMQGNWVLGSLVSNSWSYAGNDSRAKVNFGLLQPFVNYNVPTAKGFALSFSPIITADWTAPKGQKLVFPVGGGISQTFIAGRLPMSLSFALYYNVVRPDGFPNWNLRVAYALLLPKR